MERSFRICSKLIQKTNRDRGVRTAGHRASNLMLVKQLAESRSNFENQYARVVPRFGNNQGLDAIGQVYELRSSSNGAGSDQSIIAA